jgi:hypothetical protein
MKTNAPASFLTRAVSPYGLAAVSSAIFLFACVFPPGTYSSYMDEPDYMFLNISAITLFAVCVTFFVGGVWLVDLLFPVSGFRNEERECRLSPVTFLLIPLVAGLIFSALSNLIIIRNNPGLLLLFLSQGGAEAKADIQNQATLGLAGIYLIGIVWWVTWRCDQMNIQGKQRRLIKIFQYLAATSVIISTILKLARGQLMPVITGIAIIYLLQKSARAGTSRTFLLKFSLFFGGSVLGLFLLASFARGTTDMTKDVFGYTIASYNRLAALLNGKLYYPYSGRGIYLFSFVGYNNMLNAVVPFREILRWPSFMDYWQSEFAAMGRAGLTENAIWAGSFGYIFADIGWFAPVFVFLEGVFCGAIWRSIKLGRPLGIVLYPWCAYSILFWFGMNSLFDNTILAFALDVVGLSIYESLFLRQKAPQTVPALA